MGTTASGKSALSLELARRVPGLEIVSADSMQVYRGMDVGTAKPTARERAEVPHHCLDVADPGEDFSVARFQALARQAIRAVEGRGNRALLVGGTGLYVRAVVDELDLPGRWPAVRAEIESEPDTSALHARLADLDPAAAARMTSANRRRVVRALEVTLGSGRPFSSFGPGLGHHRPSRFAMAGVWLPRAVVARRVERRLGAMVRNGLVDETAALASGPGGLSRTARQALGYKEVLAHLGGRCTLDEALERAAARTVELSRRQRMWFRRDPRITWYGAPEDPGTLLPALMAHWGAADAAAVAGRRA